MDARSARQGGLDLLTLSSSHFHPPQMQANLSNTGMCRSILCSSTSQPSFSAEPDSKRCAASARNVGHRIRIKRRRHSCRHPNGSSHYEEDLSRSGDQRRIVGCRCIRQRTGNFDGWLDWPREAMLGRSEQGGSRRKRRHCNRSIWKYHRRLNNIIQLKLWHCPCSFFRYECQR
jgi:hypothetical protein